MVHIKDEGSHFDAPLDVVWKYLAAEDHGPAHKGSRNPQMKNLDDRTMELTQEINMNGQWVKVRDRITVYPPLGMSIEMLEGPMSGTKFFNFYTAKGPKTQVTVVGEFVSPQMPENRIEPAVRQMLQQLFDEDTAGLKAFAGKK